MANRGYAGSTFYRKLLRKDPCSICGSTEHRQTLDHIHPKASGGPNNWMNITAMCGGCNNKKRDMSLLDVMLGHKYRVFESGTILGEENQDTGGQPRGWYDPLRIQEYNR